MLLQRELHIMLKKALQKQILNFPVLVVLSSAFHASHAPSFWLVLFIHYTLEWIVFQMRTAKWRLTMSQEPHILGKDPLPSRHRFDSFFSCDRDARKSSLRCQHQKKKTRNVPNARLNVCAQKKRVTQILHHLFHLVKMFMCVTVAWVPNSYPPNPVEYSE